ncbi:aspartate aminotransferase family protein [Bacillus timonensis]|nr:aspartate aminotransferase family protein [Bacillus timonensis]
MQSPKLIKPVLNRDYPTISYGNGVFLYDTNGKKYLDGSSGAVTANIGHGNPEIVKVMTEQAQKISFVYRSQFTSEPAEELAEKMSQISQGDLNSTFFVNSGSEATETAMKIAIQYWQERGVKGKNKILSRWMSYHGITIGALSMSGHPARRSRFVPLLEDYPTVSPPYCYRCPFHSTYPDCQLMCALELEKAIKRVGQEHIAAFIAEPIIGAAGAAVVPPSNYYKTIKEICNRYNILFIADEVMTGFGRTGKMFAMEHWHVQPDIVAIGKGMGAGYTPIAATLVSDTVMEPILHGSKQIMSGHTFSANPLSAAVSLAVINYIEKNQLIFKSEKMGNYLFKKLKKLQNKYSIIGDVRGKGLLIGVEFVTDVINKLPFHKEVDLTNHIIGKAFSNGLIVYPASSGVEGIEGDAILIAPPLTITSEEVEELISLFERTILDVQNELQVNGIFPA